MQFLEVNLLKVLLLWFVFFYFFNLVSSVLFCILYLLFTIQVINFYMNLLMERGKKENYPSVYAFSTFFCHKLLSEGYTAVKRWTRNVNLFKHHIILVPIHLRSHWTLVVSHAGFLFFQLKN